MEKNLKNKIFNVFKNTETNLNNLRTDIAKEQKFLREHNFQIENIALNYKQEVLSEVDFIFSNLKEQIEKILG